MLTRKWVIVFLLIFNRLNLSRDSVGNASD